MLPLSEIHGVARSIRAGRSAVADAVAAAWGFAPGAARFLRSSASHVFEVFADAATPNGYLRFVPASCRGRARVDAVAGLMERLDGAGFPVAAPIASTAGNLVETVPTPLGEMHAMLVRPASGVQLNVEDLTASQARAWGAALARLHHGPGAAKRNPAERNPAERNPAERNPAERNPAERDLDWLDAGWLDLPAAFDGLGLGGAAVDELAAFADDPPLAAAVRRLTDRLDDLPRDPPRYGVIHGDFELDNLAWCGDAPTAFDFDDAARSWFVADIAIAVRDLGAVPARTPTAGETPLFAAFLAGYRESGPLDERDLAHLPLFTALHAAATLARLAAGLDAGTSPTDPGWLVALRRRLDEHVRRLRTAVLDTGAPA